jgi:peptidoglycan/xylan/chitin deacetylase (PgdA/CDA1 family)
MSWLRHRRCLARLRSALRSRPHTILLFHSIGRPAAANFLPAGLDCDVDLFENILRLLRDEAEVVPLAAVLTKAGTAALTFDDGFRDNFTVALPLLRQFRLPATAFVATDTLEADALLPIHRYYFARQHRGEFAEPTDSPARRAAVDAFMRVPPLGRDLYLRRDELRALADAGIEIGAHTCSHPWLAALPAEEQRREIVGSKQMLQETLGRPVTSFAYPYGYRESFNQTSAAVVAEQFQIACLSDDSGSAADPLALPRVNLLS